MKLMLLPPYQNPLIKPITVVRELVANMEKRGQLKGIEVDIDEGATSVDSPSETRDEERFAALCPGIINKVREYSEMGKYDAIVLTGGLGDPGFAASRAVSKIPVVAAVHAALHVASLIGNRFDFIECGVYPTYMVRDWVERCGFGHKVPAVRFLGLSSTFLSGVISKYKKEERVNSPEGKKLMDAIMTQCIAAIEKDRVDCIILGNEPMALLEDEIRQKLDEMGYDEIPIIGQVPAAVELAKVMINMKLTQAARAYPTDGLKASPEFV